MDWHFTVSRIGYLLIMASAFMASTQDKITVPHAILIVGGFVVYALAGIAHEIRNLK
jgi:hypothetical protein